MHLAISILRVIFGFAILIHTASAANELTLHFVPAPTPIDWTRPETLARTTLLNQFAKYHGGDRHSIGHVFEELECGNSHFFTGADDIGDSQEENALFKGGEGLGIILRNYVGILNNTDEAETDLAEMHASGRSNFLRFQVSEETCHRLVKYVKQYQLRGYDKIYGGLNARPRRGEGSGCSAFGVSFLELAGLEVPEFESSFMRSFIVPRKFVGGDLTQTKVSFLKILFAKTVGWDPDLSANGFALHFYDPELMHAWVARAVRSVELRESRVFPWPVSAAYLGHSEGLVFDATKVPTPTDPIFEVP
jgi:hypothetical protein